MSPEAYLLQDEAVSINDLNQELEALTPSERVERAAELFAGRLVVATSFGPTSPFLLDKVREAEADLPVVNIRHHHETLKTLELSGVYQREFDLDVRVYDAEPVPIQPEGSRAFADFQRQVKVEPFQRMLDELQPQAYLSGVMRWQSPERTDRPIVEDKGAVIAINPVVDTSHDEVEQFFEETRLPRDDDYFDPTKGRGQNLECQLNTTIYERRED